MKEPRVDVFHGYGLDGNIFLVEGEVIIDSGTGHYHNVFMDWLNERTDPSDVHTLILTHRHYDHSGGAADIIRELDVEAYIHEADAPPVMNGDLITTGARAFNGEQIPISVTQILEDHIFNIVGLGFRVLHTPGHTIGSISLFNDDLGILFSGDTIFANGGVGRWDLATGDHESLRRSIAELAKLEIRDLYPSHDVEVLGEGKKHASLALESINQDPMELMRRRLDMVQNTM